MTHPRLQDALRTLSQATLELAQVCDRDIDEFAGNWHRIASNASALETMENVDPDDVKDLLGSIRWLFGYHPGSFMEQYIARADLDEQSRENERFDALKKRVGQAAAEVRKLMNIDPRSY